MREACRTCESVHVAHIHDACHINSLYHGYELIPACLPCKICTYSWYMWYQLIHIQLTSWNMSYQLIHIQLHVIWTHSITVQTAVYELIHDMGWLRLVGFLKLWGSFAKEPYQRDCILQKRPIILRSLLIVATPYLSYQLFHIQLTSWYISRPLKIIGLFCKRALSKRLYSAKETYNFKEASSWSMSYEFIHLQLQVVWTHSITVQTAVCELIHDTCVISTLSYTAHTMINDISIHSFTTCRTHMTWIMTRLLKIIGLFCRI